MKASQQNMRRLALDALIYGAVGGLTGWLLVAFARSYAPQAFTSMDLMQCVNFSVLLGLLRWLTRVNRIPDSATGRSAEPGPMEIQFEHPRPTRLFSERLACYLHNCRKHQLPCESSVSRMPFHGHQPNQASHPPKPRWWIRLLLIRIHNKLST